MRQKRVVIIINYGYCLRPVPAIGSSGQTCFSKRLNILISKVSFSPAHCTVRLPTFTTNRFRIFIASVETDNVKIHAYYVVRVVSYLADRAPVLLPSGV